METYLSAPLMSQLQCVQRVGHNFSIKGKSLHCSAFSFQHGTEITVSKILINIYLVYKEIIWKCLKQTQLFYFWYLSSFSFIFFQLFIIITSHGSICFSFQKSLILNMKVFILLIAICLAFQSTSGFIRRRGLG